MDLPDLLARLHWLGHASFRLDGPPTIYFDPAVSLKGAPPQADVILIGHSHNDHYFPVTLKRISRPETVIITTHLVATLAQADGIPGQVRALRPGERTTVGAAEIQTVPAYNISKSWHPKASENLGFIVMLYGRRIYFAGDTDLIPEMADIRADVALLPVGGTYTMDAQEAAQAAAILKPKVVVPMHTLDADLEQFRSLCNCEVLVMKEE
jgi:L-ascorbate metabolism protein UlaG (beta-lactamase superfamily)